LSPKSGWVEKRRQERVLATLKMEYRIVNGSEAKALLEKDSYRQTRAEHLPELSEKSPLCRAVTKDISLGGLALVSQQPLEKGALLEVSLQLPNYQTVLKFLAEIRHVQTTVELGRNLFHAGIRTLAIHQGDVERIGKYLIERKKKGGGGT
jgi:c-di-GMP-binding flagellar brake protein YcgR